LRCVFPAVRDACYYKHVAVGVPIVLLFIQMSKVPTCSICVHILGPSVSELAPIRTGYGCSPV
jgi:hypothetical protein